MLEMCAGGVVKWWHEAHSFNHMTSLHEPITKTIVDFQVEPTFLDCELIVSTHSHAQILIASL